MITIILENEKNEVIERIGARNNRDYLLRYTDNPDYKILSEISNYDNEIIIQDNAPELIGELEAVKSNLETDQISHIDEIIRLARIAREHKRYALVFAPFET